MAQLADIKSGPKLGLMPTVFATVAALYFAQAVLIPLAVAVLLTFLMIPAGNLLGTRGPPRHRAVFFPRGPPRPTFGAVWRALRTKILGVGGGEGGETREKKK